MAEPIAEAEPPAEVAEPAAAEASCQDGAAYRESCPSWAAAGECEANAAFMLLECQRSCGCKEAPPAPPPSSEAPACEDRDKSGSCAAWMAAGECDANPSFMKLKCAASCGTCDMLDYKKRCPPPTVEPSVPPGAMAAMFERAVSNFPEYEPEMLSLDPPVLVFEKFVRDDEVRPPPRPAPPSPHPSPRPRLTTTHHPPPTDQRPTIGHRPPPLPGGGADPPRGWPLRALDGLGGEAGGRVRAAHLRHPHLVDDLVRTTRAPTRTPNPNPNP